jgi:hypothetical protein
MLCAPLAQMAAAHAAALQKQLVDAGASLNAASVSFGALVASGGISDAQVQAMTANITASVTASVTNAMAAQLQPVTLQLQRLSDDLLATRVLACKSYNATCGEGGARPYVPVPNAAGVLVPAGEQQLLNRDALVGLTAARAARWCMHYGIASPAALADRRSAVAAQLGVVALLHQ